MTSTHVSIIMTYMYVTGIITSICVSHIDMTMYDFSGCQEDSITAMLGSFVDVQPDGSDSP